MKRDSVLNRQYYYLRNMILDSIGSIKFFGSQYDSITEKYLYQKGEVQIEN